MPLRLDHIVHAVADLEQAAEAFRELGLHVAPGGRHPGLGTRNALVCFDLTYIELVTVQDAAEAVGATFGSLVLDALSRGDGPATVAFGTDDIAGAAGVASRAGVPVEGPHAASRQRPDGSAIQWQMALLPAPQPFLIQWGQSDQERRADLAARGVIAEHPRGAGLRLRQVCWAVPSLVTAADWLSRTYGARVAAPGRDADLGAICAATDLGVTLCAPDGPGLTASRLAGRGQGPFLCELTGPAATPALLEACGAWLRIRPD